MILVGIELQPDAVPLVATGEVDGWLPSQFAMDEDAGGRLRVATTSGGNFSPVARNSNGVYVLAQDGTDLKTVGSVTGIADGEHLTSARFVGDSAYLVTFRQVDPLFSVDLADPEHPKVAGELKVPGFSSYLHPAADGLLLGLGRDADEAGRITGLQLSLFDVSRPSRPVRVDAEAIDLGGAYSNSAAEYDHHAFAYFPESQVVAVPVDAYNFEGAGSHRVVVFKVSKGQGLVPLGEVSLDENASRTFRIGGVLYVVSQNTVKAVTVDDPTVQVGLLDLRDKS